MPPALPVRYPVDMVISSGTVATREVFDIAGNFDEGLFIDHVDAEWCIRCRARQIPIYVIPTAVMRHSIGSRYVKLGPLTIQVHSPTRMLLSDKELFPYFSKTAHSLPFCRSAAGFGDRQQDYAPVFCEGSAFLPQIIFICSARRAKGGHWRKAGFDPRIGPGTNAPPAVFGPSRQSRSNDPAESIKSAPIA